MKKKIIQETLTYIVNPDDLVSALNNEAIQLKDSTKYHCLYKEIVEFKKVKTWYEVSIFSIHMKRTQCLDYIKIS